MRLGMYLTSLTKPELEEILEVANFTEEETQVFNMLAKKKSLIQMSDTLCVSISTIKRRITEISKKVGKVYGYNKNI